jgi:hypothetical protein
VPSSQRPPENSLSGETRQGFDIANELGARFLYVALQPFLCLLDQLPRLARLADIVNRPMQEAEHD